MDENQRQTPHDSGPRPGPFRDLIVSTVFMGFMISIVNLYFPGSALFVAIALAVLSIVGIVVTRAVKAAHDRAEREQDSLN
jgi:hypothetical protein